MSVSKTTEPKLDFLSGGGEMGALMRAHDWSATPLGSPETWPQSLRTTVRLLITTRHPMFIWWGPELIQFYNDAYRQTMGPERHPAALGQRGRECWDEIWDIIGPQIELVLSGGGATWHEEQLVPVTRYGKREDVWWTYGYSPIDDETRPSGVGGVLVVCNDVTERRIAVESLTVHQERLRLALDAGVIGVWDWHIPTDRVFADERFARLYNVDPAAAAVGAPIATFVAAIHPQDRDRVGGAIQATVKTGDNFHSEYRLIQSDGSIRWVLARGYCLRDGDNQPLRFPGAVIDITERKEAEQHRKLLTDELNHRVKNTLTVVQAIASQSLRNDRPMPEARSAFIARLKAISNAHDVLTGERWAGADLGSIVHVAVDVYAKDDLQRVKIHGPSVRLSPSCALAVALALNELSTNAIKYGALSTASGDVEVSWTIATSNDGERRLQIRWTEHSGPSVSAPARRGFGSRLIKDALAAEIGGEVTIVYDPAGLICTIDAPLKMIEEAGSQRIDHERGTDVTSASLESAATPD